MKIKLNEEGTIVAEATRGIEESTPEMESFLLTLPLYAFKAPIGVIPAEYELRLVQQLHIMVENVVKQFLEGMAREAEKKSLRMSAESGIEEPQIEASSPSLEG